MKNQIFILIIIFLGLFQSIYGQDKNFQIGLRGSFVPEGSELSSSYTIILGIEGKFRTPTLRNLSVTGPYFHNGTFATLEQTVNFYADFERNDEDAQRLNFDANEVDAIVAFLKTLNDDNFDRIVPDNVPSGLSVGGNINQ